MGPHPIGRSRSTSSKRNTFAILLARSDWKAHKTGRNDRPKLFPPTSRTWGQTADGHRSPRRPAPQDPALAGLGGAHHAIRRPSSPGEHPRSLAREGPKVVPGETGQPVVMEMIDIDQDVPRGSCELVDLVGVTSRVHTTNVLRRLAGPCTAEGDRCPVKAKDPNRLLFPQRVRRHQRAMVMPLCPYSRARPQQLDTHHWSTSGEDRRPVGCRCPCASEGREPRSRPRS